MKLTIFSLLVCLVLVVGVCYSSPAPPVLIAGEIVDYNIAGIDVKIMNTRTGFVETIQTNYHGEFQYEYLNSLSCNDNILISVLGITESGKIVCDINNEPIGYKDSRTGSHIIRFDFSGSCPACNCARCDSCCSSCNCGTGGGGGTTVVINKNCSEIECEELYPYEEVICQDCEVCQECAVCKDCAICKDCEVCKDCESGIIWRIIGVIFGIVAGAGITMSVRRDENGKLVFCVKKHRHKGRNYLHSIYRIHRAPYKHEYGEIMPKFKTDDEGKWEYVPRGD